MLYKIITSVALISLVACVGTKAGKNRNGFANNPVVAHRGAFKTGSLPENSIAGLKKAIALQCTGSEFDVWMTADDSLVINHDPNYQKLTIEKVTYKELLAFPLSNGEKIPTLREYLQAGLVGNTATRLVLEIKPSNISKERGKLVARKCYEMVNALRAAPMVTYISFDFGILEQLVALNKKIPTQYLNGDKTPEELKAAGISGADYHFSVFRKNPDWIDRSKKNGIVLNAWTANSREDLNWLLDQGFPLITTNEPELLFELVKERANKQ
jgi:glycerophosphoryl diester phosphodiesterase